MHAFSFSVAVNKSSKMDFPIFYNSGGINRNHTVLVICLMKYVYMQIGEAIFGYSVWRLTKSRPDQKAVLVLFK